MTDPVWGTGPVLVIIGVSGSGKSTVAELLVGRLGWDLAEGDELHPPANVAKMAAGHPLDDADRAPWLAEIATWIREHTSQGRPGVITCSALKRRYRDVLAGDHVIFVYLAGSHSQIAHRLAGRHGHFMPAAMLNSQLATLEPPGTDERAIAVDLGQPPSAQAEEIIRRLQLFEAAAPSQPDV